MNSNQKIKITTIAEHYGLEHQLGKAQEELRELYEEVGSYLQEFKLGNDNICAEKMIDEMADVKIMLKQLEYLLDCKQEIKERIEFKLDRQIGRIISERED